MFILEHVNCKATELALLTTPELLWQVSARLNYIVLIAVCLALRGRGVTNNRQFTFVCRTQKADKSHNIKGPHPPPPPPPPPLRARIVVLASSPGPTFYFTRVGPGSRNFNGNHKSGCLYGDAFTMTSFHSTRGQSTRVETLPAE